MLVASWNVNSVKSRLSHVLAWLKDHQPDVLLLQELKGTTFPGEAFEAIGYRSEFVAQKNLQWGGDPVPPSHQGRID